MTGQVEGNLGNWIQGQLVTRNGRDLLEFIAAMENSGVRIAAPLAPDVVAAAKRCFNASPSVALELLNVALGAVHTDTGMLEVAINEFEDRIARDRLGNSDSASCVENTSLAGGIQSLRKRIREVHRRHQEVMEVHGIRFRQALSIENELTLTDKGNLENSSAELMNLADKYLTRGVEDWMFSWHKERALVHFGKAAEAYCLAAFALHTTTKTIPTSLATLKEELSKAIEIPDSVVSAIEIMEGRKRWKIGPDFDNYERPITFFERAADVIREWATKLPNVEPCNGEHREVSVGINSDLEQDIDYDDSSDDDSCRDSSYIAICDRCEGSGIGHEVVDCPNCEGHGCENRDSQDEKICEECLGKGEVEIEIDPCEECHGTGEVELEIDPSAE